VVARLLLHGKTQGNMTTLTSHPSGPPISTVRPLFSERYRRASRRTPFHASVQVLGRAVGSGVTLNASEGGLRIAVDCVLRPDEICLVRVDDPARGRIERARVAWSHELPDGCIAGLQLLGLH
jgi:PilZ domain-containing protein